MSRQEAIGQYGKALRSGQKYYRDCVVHGRYPYPQVLDEILEDGTMIAGHVDLGLVEIPMEQIVGNKTAGRRSAFAGNFMPLLASGTEFADKWVNLCEAHLSDEGIREPIRCFEYLGRFYVQEGNKRVSVLKSYDAPAISGKVTRIVPVWSEDTAIRAYYEFMQFYQLTGLYRVNFTRPGSFAKLQTALGFEQDHLWTEDEQRKFESRFTYFRAAFKKLGGESLPITAADALLAWLKIYDYEQLHTMSAADLNKSLSALWSDIQILADPDPVSVATESDVQEKDSEKNVLSRIIKTVFPVKLKIAFLNEHSPDESDWIRAHYLGSEYLEAVMGDKVQIGVMNGVGAGAGADAAMESAIENGAQVVFATTPPLIAACRKAAAKHPDVKILNCSVAMPYTGVRTYYSKIYEGKFITGAIAGAMSASGRIGYVASNPILGVPASINAFALGARLTNPRASIHVRWSCVDEDPIGMLCREGAEFVSNRDIPTPDRVREPWGLCQIRPDGGLDPVASPYWHWGHFYEKMVRSILAGGWDALSSKDNKRAVNYWWGMKSSTVGILLGQNLPSGLKKLTEILRRGIADGNIDPFRQPIRSQNGATRSDGDYWFSPEEILHMDWLCDCVVGEIPGFDQLLPMSRSIVRLQGVYRDTIPPEKEGVLL